MYTTETITQGSSRAIVNYVPEHAIDKAARKKRKLGGMFFVKLKDLPP